VEGYEGVEALRGVRPPTAVVLQGRTPETRRGCAGWGGWWSWRWRWIFIILHSVALQSLENVIDERLLGCDGCLEIGNLVF
jgi:hypothetical protein